MKRGAPFKVDIKNHDQDGVQVHLCFFQGEFLSCSPGGLGCLEKSLR